jgi:alpha-L-fucosidase
MSTTPVQWSVGTRPEIKRGEYMIPYDIMKETLNPDPGQAVKEIFFTQKGTDLFAIVPKWPGKELKVTLPPVTRHLSLVTFLQTGQPLKFRTHNNDLVITLPAYDPNAKWTTEAYVFKIETK